MSVCQPRMGGRCALVQQRAVAAALSQAPTVCAQALEQQIRGRSDLTYSMGVGVTVHESLRALAVDEPVTFTVEIC